MLTFSLISFKECVTEVFPKVDEGSKAQLEIEDVDEEPPSALLLMRNDSPESPLP